MKRVAIITSSDMGFQGKREDLSGPAIQEIVEREGYQVVSMDILPDDRAMLSKRMAEIADENQAELILTTGGTGFSPRDVMPEATEDITERKVPGIPEAIRAYSMTITNRAMLSRATAGIRKKTLIINLPGSPKAVKESLEYIIGALGHGIEIMTGEAGNCARQYILINFIVNENLLHYAAVAFVEGILSLGADEDCLWLLFHSFKILACYNQRVVYHIFQCLICKICGVRQHKYIRHRV